MMKAEIELDITERLVELEIRRDVTSDELPVLEIAVFVMTLLNLVMLVQTVLRTKFQPRQQTLDAV